MKRFFIGIDVSKETLDVALFERENMQEWQHEQVRNDRGGWNGVLRLARELGKRFGCKLNQDEFVFCCENTGVYSVGLCEFLHKRRMTICQEHALSIKRSMGMQRGKTDKTDALVIAEYAMRFEDRLTPFQPLTPVQKQLRELLNYRATLVRQRAALKTRRSEKGELDETSRALAFIRRNTEGLVHDMDEAVRRIEKRMEELVMEDEDMRQAYLIMRSMPGIGLINAVTLLVRTQGFKKFDYNSRQLACYYGIAPFPHESGTSVRGLPHVSRYADRSLKSVLSQAALAAVQFNPVIGTYYRRCLSRGKHPAVALNNVKNKMLHILVSMVKNGRMFDENHEINRKTA